MIQNNLADTTTKRATFQASTELYKPSAGPVELAPPATYYGNKRHTSSSSHKSNEGDRQFPASRDYSGSVESIMAEDEEEVSLFSNLGELTKLSNASFHAKNIIANSPRPSLGMTMPLSPTGRRNTSLQPSGPPGRISSEPVKEHQPLARTALALPSPVKVASKLRSSTMPANQAMYGRRSVSSTDSMAASIGNVSGPHQTDGSRSSSTVTSSQPPSIALQLFVEAGAADTPCCDLGAAWLAKPSRSKSRSMAPTSPTHFSAGMFAPPEFTTPMALAVEQVGGSTPPSCAVFSSLGEFNACLGPNGTASGCLKKMPGMFFCNGSAVVFNPSKANGASRVVAEGDIGSVAIKTFGASAAILIQCAAAPAMARQNSLDAKPMLRGRSNSALTAGSTTVSPKSVVRLASLASIQNPGPFTTARRSTTTNAATPVEARNLGNSSPKELSGNGVGVNPLNLFD